jgi:nitrogen fixation protein NifU and related proteins
MQELRELYQEIILDHNKNPRNFHKMENPTRAVEGQNPLCGDHYTVYLLIEDNRIRDISFEGAGCAISKASGSLMSSILKGKKRDETEKLFKLFQRMVTGEIDPADHLAELGKLAAFAGVAEFPLRVKCAILPWHAMFSALNGDAQRVSSEENKNG